LTLCSHPAPPRVLAAVTLYKPQRDVAHYVQLISRCIETQRNVAEVDLAGILLFDNSPAPLQANGTLSHQMIWLEHDPENGGTRAALMRAIGLAIEHRCDWILMLDQDTTPPNGFVPAMLAARHEAARAAALVPDVVDGTCAVSPCRERWGRIRPCRSTDSRPTTAVLSGSLLRVSQLEHMPLPPAHLWLDYLDHWVFRWIRKAGGTITRVSICVNHRLSVSTWGSLPAWRAENILASERDYYSSEPEAQRLANRVWLVGRAISQLVRRSPHWYLVARASLCPNSVATQRPGASPR
jgi:hypothetical protein